MDWTLSPAVSEKTDSNRVSLTVLKDNKMLSVRQRVFSICFHLFERQYARQIVLHIIYTVLKSNLNVFLTITLKVVVKFSSNLAHWKPLGGVLNVRGAEF